MADLTRDYLDKKLDKLSKGLTGFIVEQDKKLRTDLTSFIVGQDNKLKTDLTGFIAKQDNKLKADVTTSLKAVIIRENEKIARMVAKGFEDVIKRLDVTERVEKLERDFSQLKQALNLQ